MDPHPWAAPGLPPSGTEPHRRPPSPGERNPHGLHSPFRWRRIRTRRRTAFRVTVCGCEAFHLWPKPRGDVLLRITYPGVGVIAGATGGGSVLRIHMSGVDLSQVRMATRPDALWETALSFHRLRDRRGSAVFGKWRTETRPRLNGEVRLLSAVIPPRGYFPDFLTPSQESGEPYGIDAGMQALRETPPGRVRAELALLGAERRDACRSPDARAEPLGRLVDALRSYHRAAIEPYWPHIRASVEADRAVRGRALLDGGAHELLASLPPMIRWRAPVLEADYPVDREIRLDGRGCCSSRRSSAASPRSSTATRGSRRSSSTRSPTPAPRSSPNRAPGSADSSAAPARRS